MAQLPTVELVSGFLAVKFPYSPEYVAKVKAIGYAHFEPNLKTWLLPNSGPNLEALKAAFPSIVLGPVLRGENKVEAESLLEAELRKYIPEQRKIQITDFTFKTEPLWHQAVSFNFARALDCSAILLEQGLGKTKIAADLITWRYRQGQVKRALFLAPNSVVPQWLTTDVTKHLHDDFNKVTILEGSTKERVKTLERLYEEDLPGFIIVNYEALIGLEDFLIKMQGKQSKLFQQMVLDESSKIKHAASQRAKASWHIGKTVRFRNIMSGTPVTQSAEDVFSQYRFLDDRVYGPYVTAFRGTYLILGGFENRQIIGYRNIEDMFSKMFSLGIRFTKKLCLSLPDKTYEKRYARLGKEVSEKYKTLEKECVAEFDGKQISAPLAMARAMKLAEITGGFIYEQNEAGERVATHTFDKNAKLEVLDEILDEVLPSKVIVWCHYQAEISIILGALSKRGVRYVTVHGGIRPSGPQVEIDGQMRCVCGECRGCAVRVFQEDPECRVFVGQISTAGYGITLTAASFVVYYSLTYSYEERAQSEDRNHRIGQKNAVTYIDILALTDKGKSTIDQDIFDIVKTKDAFAGEVSKALISRMMGRGVSDV